MVGEEIWQVKILVSGRVQGVLFRSNTKRRADQLGIYGWVRNLPDGKVEIIAQGTTENLNQLISWCKKGPIFAKIEDVESIWQKPKEIFASFEIVY